MAEKFEQKQKRSLVESQAWTDYSMMYVATSFITFDKDHLFPNLYFKTYLRIYGPGPR